MGVLPVCHSSVCQAGCQGGATLSAFDSLRALLAIPARKWGMWGVSNALIHLEGYAFDYFVYPFMLFVGGAYLVRLTFPEMPDETVAQAGYWLGFGIMFAISVLLNILYVRVYDAAKRDLFGLEALTVRSRQWVGARFQIPFRIVMFCYLSIVHNPLFATLWVRSRDQDFTMQRRDWAIFAGAIVTANVGWTVLVTVVAQLVRIVGLLLHRL